MRPIAALPLVLAVLLAAPAARAAKETRPTAAEVVALSGASALALSPDGTRVAFVRTTTAFDSTAKPKDGDTKAGWKVAKQVWVADVATKQARQLTFADANAASPCWSPDGRTLAFVREAGGKPTLHLLPVDGGEAAPLATGALEPSSPAFSPDGGSVAFLAGEAPAAAEQRARWARGGAILWEREFANTKLHVVPVAGGEPREIPAGPNVLSYAWSPDGRKFAVVTSESADPYVVSNVTRAALVGSAGRTPARPIDRPAGTYGPPAWSPDGRRVAFASLSGGLSNLNALLACDAVTGSVQDLAPDRDRTFGGIAWSEDSKSVIAVVRARTETKLERFPLEGAPAPLPFAGRVIAGELAAGDAGRRLAFLSSTDRAPAEVTTFDPATGATAVVTDLNPQVASWRLGTSQVVRWKNAEGAEIEGVFTPAAGAKPGVPSPLVVVPHGGPDDVTSVGFSPLTQYLASRGYAVLRPNYRGSFGYGFAFYEANRNRFGEIEQADIESGVDHLVAEKLADPAKLYYGGWSWGGYITTWTITHVHRYRAAVAGAAVSDVRHSYSLSDINHGAAAQWEFQGDPWNQPEHFDRVNPIRHVANVKTPLLMFHGQADARVPFAESVQFHRALTDLGREVELWAYPREPHNFTEPAHRVDYLKKWVDWYDRH